MGCLLVLFGLSFPRLAIFFVWLARPAVFTAAISSGFVALLGIIFVPFTTLMYVLLWSPAGLTGFDWLWITLAFLVDIGSLGASAWGYRGRAAAYTA